MDPELGLPLVLQVDQSQVPVLGPQVLADLEMETAKGMESLAAKGMEKAMVMGRVVLVRSLPPANHYQIQPPQLELELELVELVMVMVQEQGVLRQEGQQPQD